MNSSSGMISSNKNNLGLLRKTSAYKENRNYIKTTKIEEDKIDLNAIGNLEDSIDVHSEKLSKLKYIIFFFGFIPWGVFFMWWMGLFG